MLRHRPLPASGDPFYPSLNKTIPPPKPSRADGSAGTRPRSSVRGQQLCKAPSPPVSQAKGHFDTPRVTSLPSPAEATGKETPRWPPASARARGRAHAAPCQHSPLNRAQLQLKRRFKGGAATKIPPLDWNNSSAAPRGDRRHRLTGREAHAGFLHERTRVEGSPGSER